VGPVFVRQRVSATSKVTAIGVLALLLAGCGDDGGDTPFPTTIEECGSSLSALLAAESDAAPHVNAGYSEALAEWSLSDGFCGLGVFSGVCADGKRVLYRNGGFSTEIRYYEGEQLVGYVGSGDLGYCPSVCPFSHFFGTPESVRCEAPSFEALCARAPAPENGAGVWMPFANGQPPGGCEP
jgi:hypothetical protein